MIDQQWVCMLYDQSPLASDLGKNEGQSLSKIQNITTTESPVP